MVETLLCKLQGTSDTFVGRTYSIFHLLYVFCEQNLVLYDTSTRCTYSSPESLVPGAAYIPGTWYGTCNHQTIQIRGTGVCRARKNSL